MSARQQRRGVRRAVVVLPNGFTLANLFFGIFAIVSASRGDFVGAGWYVVIGGVCDAFDGRIARVTRTGSRFGEELDSLVDAITFGLAPAMIMYFAILNREGWDWIWVFLFAACAVVRLARFNVEQAGSAKTHFRGLPSPAAGLTLATYYWFSQTDLYLQTAIADLPWHVMLRFVMALLAFLMISDVPYPAVPRINFRTLRGIVGAVIVIGAVLGLIFLPKQFFFPVFLGYVAYGAIRYFVLGLLDRDPGDTSDPRAVSARPNGPVTTLSPGGFPVEIEESLLDDDDVDELDELDEVEEIDERPRRRRRRKRPRGDFPTGESVTEDPSV